MRGENSLLRRWLVVRALTCSQLAISLGGLVSSEIEGQDGIGGFNFAPDDRSGPHPPASMPQSSHPTPVVPRLLSVF